MSQTYTLEAMQVLSGTSLVPTVTVKVGTPSGIIEAAATGDGPVAAALKAISQAVGKDTAELTNYRVQSVTRGREALGEVNVWARFGGVTVMGSGISTDVVEASAQAWLQAMNHLEAGQGRRTEARDGV